MKTLKRITAALLTLVMLIPGTVAINIYGSAYVDAELMDHAEKIADVVRDFGTSYKFKDGISTDDLHTVMSIVLNDNPDFYHLSASYRYSYNSNRPDIATELLLDYKMTRDEYAAASAEVQQWVDKVVSLADPSFTEFEYALFFHDYIASNYEYDTTNTVRDVYNFIKTGIGVCQAYTYTYELLLNAVGIDSSFASSNEMNHIWNLVEIGGKWYHVDVTWDDPIGNTPGKANHDYFLLSDGEIYGREQKHYGWIAYHDCSSEKYDDIPLSQAQTSYAYLDGVWYYMKSGDLYVTDSLEEEGTKYVSLDLRWNVWQSSSYYTDVYSGLIARDGMLYANSSDKVIMIDPSDKSVTEIKSYTDGDGYIYGFTIYMGEDKISGADMSTGKVVLNISTHPTKSDSKLIVSLIGDDTVSFPGNGDGNGDGKINLTDVSCILKHIAKWSIEINIEAADMDGNSIVNLSDATALMKKIAGWSASADGQ